MPYTRKPIKINEMTKFTTKGAYEVMFSVFCQDSFI